MRPNLTRKLEGNKFRFSLRRIWAMPLGSKLALVVVFIVVLAAIFAPFLAPHEPLKIFSARHAPNGDFWFGTDDKGRDVFSRLLYGARYSLVIGILATAFALACATVIGSVAAVSRKWISEVVMRIMDIIMSFPGIALAAVFVAVFGNSIPVLIFAIGFLYIPQLTRVVRANVISEYGEDYVNAVVVSGARAPWILSKHVARNCIAPIMVFATVLVADAIVFEASLSFIQAGVPEPNPSWGNILADARTGVLAGLWWQAFFPGLAIMITVLCLNVLSEGLTDAMVAAPSGEIAPKGGGEQEDEGAQLTEEDPVASYAQQRESLERRLAELRECELARGRTSAVNFSGTPLLEVKDLCISFPRHGDVNVVDHVSFKIHPGETMGLVGESGCGKSITALTVMGLLDPKAHVTGEVLYQGQNLLDMTAKQRNGLRGHELAMIYQDALSSLNPSMLIRSQLKQLTKRGGTRTAEELLELVGLDPQRVLGSYPHELSGGQRQRVLIAMALTRDPKLVIADEPTTALDVTVQKQVIKLLNELREKLGFALLFVSHDLALVAEVAHSITVMYAGQVVEQAPTGQLLTDPHHEYTRGLLGSVLSIEAEASRLYQIPGSVPSPSDFPAGDRFAPRSSHPDVGLDVRPVLVSVDGHPQHRYARIPGPQAGGSAEGSKDGEQR